MIKIINSILSNFNLVIISSNELQAYNLTVSNKAVLEEKIAKWYEMYHGENFARFFGLNK
jgi:hypothetical protein